MRRTHLEALRPICPRCRVERGRCVPLVLAAVQEELDGVIVEGIFHCPDAECRLEYPIIDGIPLLVPDIRRYIAENAHHLTARDDLSSTMEGLLGDGIGPGTAYDAARQQLSIYAWDHYAEFDPEETGAAPGSGPPAHGPGAVSRCLAAGLTLVGAGSDGPAIDLGCAVGRAGFDLARQREGLVLGIDLSFPMLRTAQRLLTRHTVRYPRRRIGIVYDRREFPVRFEGADRLDFWACDALALPFPDGAFTLAVGLNVIDCVASPCAFLESVRSVLQEGGSVVLTTPYDWSLGATAVEAWIGGHSQRGPDAGAGEPLLRALLTPEAHPQSVSGLRLTAERASFPWLARVHERSTVSYDLHMVVARRQP